MGSAPWVGREMIGRLVFPEGYKFGERQRTKVLKDRD